MDTLSDFPELVAEHEQLVELIRAGTRPPRARSWTSTSTMPERLLVAAVAG
jgi:hypothetical protein